MKIVEKAVEAAIEKSDYIKKLFGMIRQTVKVLEVVTHGQVKVAEAVLTMTDTHNSLHAEHEELLAQHEMLLNRYNEVCLKLEEQQGTNAELYSLLLKLANAMKEKGLDPKFPKMEFESTPKKPTSGGVN